MNDSNKIMRLIDWSLENPEFTINECIAMCEITSEEFSGWKSQIFMLNGANESALPDTRLRWRLSPNAFWGYSAIKAQERSDQKSRIAIYIAIGSLAIASLAFLVNGAN